MKGGRAGLRLRGAFDSLAAGSRLPRGDIERHVAAQLHVFRFNSARVMADAPTFIRHARGSGKPVADGVAPDDGVACLVLEAPQHVFVALLIHAALQRLPLGDERSGAAGTHIM